ncbi:MULTISPECIES: GntR family transcriptional regulator [Paraburkholderia]|uniref:GntR family transcriptional regulator n=1 Tax=Paraburkholderia metrosideri TaxID=580937 RepID=A0ABW9E175_9BURK
MLFDPDVPLHHQIYQQMRSEILDGVWVGRDDFPGEEDLATRFDVSVITSRRALMRLADEGLVVRERGRRPRATFEPSRVGRPGKSPVVFPIGPQRPYVYRVIEIENRVASAEACAVFGLHYGDSLWHCSRLRLFEGRPHSVVLNVQRKAVGERHSNKQLETLPMNQILMSEGFKLGVIKRKVAGRLPGPLVAEQLGISMQTVILVYTFVLTDDTESPLEWVQISLHPDDEPPLEVFDLRTGSAWTTDIV